MMNLGRLVGLTAFGLLVGCGPVGPEELEHEAAVRDELANITVSEASVVEPLPTYCALASNTNSCVNSGYTSCTGWSDYTSCEPSFLNTCTTTLDSACMKLECDPLGCHSALGQRKPATQQQRLRVCINSSGATCTEKEVRTLSYVCC